MELSLQEIYEITLDSLKNNPEDWHWKEIYQHKNIPYEIINGKLNISIWIANKTSGLKLEIPGKFQVKNTEVIVTKKTKLPTLNYFKRYKLYKNSMKLFNKKETKWKLNIDKQTIRDIKLKKLIN